MTREQAELLIQTLYRIQLALEGIERNTKGKDNEGHGN
jgi:hypothetical protein